MLQSVGRLVGSFLVQLFFVAVDLSLSLKMHTNGYVSALIVLQYSLTFFVSLEKPVHLYLYLCKSVSVAGFVLFLLFRESIWNKNKEVLRGHNEKIEEQSDASTCEANQQNIEEELLLFFCCFFFFTTVTRAKTERSEWINCEKIDWEKCVHIIYKQP